MAVPSGGGTEVLYRASMSISNSDVWHYLGGEGFSGASGTTIRTIDAHKIITILNFNVTETGNANVGFSCDARDEANSLTPRICRTDLPAYGTFVYNDKIIMHYQDYIRFAPVPAATMTVTVNYIIQDWN